MILFLEIIAARLKREFERIFDLIAITADRRQAIAIKVEKTRAGR
jgi:hypothetical protein